jgi:hypothetical protein
MSETRVHVVITDVRPGDRPHASSVVNVPSGAGQARFRAAALSECCRFVNRTTRSPVCGECGCRAPTGWAKTKPGAQTRRSASWGHRSRDGGTESSSGGVNWGTSARREADGINQETAVAGRSSDVAIVSDEAGGQNNRWRSQGPLGAVGATNDDDCTGMASQEDRNPWTYAGHRMKHERAVKRRWAGRAAPKGWLEAVLGKTHRTEF